MEQCLVLEANGITLVGGQKEMAGTLESTLLPFFSFEFKKGQMVVEET